MPYIKRIKKKKANKLACQYNGSLNNMGMNLMGLLTCSFLFFFSVVNTTVLHDL